MLGGGCSYCYLLNQLLTYSNTSKQQPYSIVLQVLPLLKIALILGSLGVCLLSMVTLIIKENLILELLNASVTLPTKNGYKCYHPTIEKYLCLLMSLLLKLNVSSLSLIFRGRTHAWKIRMICSRIFLSPPQRIPMYLSQVLYSLPLIQVHRQLKHRLQVLLVHYKFTHEGQNLLSNLCKFQILN